MLEGLNSSSSWLKKPLVKVLAAYLELELELILSFMRMLLLLMSSSSRSKVCMSILIMGYEI